MGGTLQSRLRGLIQDSGRSLNAEATRIGVNQQTLDKIVRGTVKSPSARLLHTIAGKYGVDVEWLVTGEGRGPAPKGERFAEAFEWKELIQSLDLTEAEQLVMLHFPTLIQEMAAWYVVAPRVGRAATDVDPALRVHRAYAGEVDRAIREARGAWVRLFRDWINTEGAVEVTRQVKSHIEDFRWRMIPTDKNGERRPLPPSPPPAEKPARRKR